MRRREEILFIGGTISWEGKGLSDYGPRFLPPSLVCTGRNTCKYAGGEKRRGEEGLKDGVAPTTRERRRRVLIEHCILVFMHASADLKNSMLLTSLIDRNAGFAKEQLLNENNLLFLKKTILLFDKELWGYLRFWGDIIVLHLPTFLPLLPQFGIKVIPSSCERRPLCFIWVLATPSPLCMHTHARLR